MFAPEWSVRYAPKGGKTRHFRRPMKDVKVYPILALPAKTQEALIGNYIVPKARTPL